MKKTRASATSGNPARPASPLASVPAVATRERRQRVQSAQTGVSVLKGLARLGGRANLSVLAGHLGESPAKVHRYLASFIDEGLVVQESGSQQYLLGLEAMLIGVAALRQADPVRAAEPALVRLREQLEVTSFVAVMGNKGPTIIRFEEPGLPVTVNVRVGSVLSLLWSATGRVFLGLLNESRVLDMARDELGHADGSLLATLDRDDPVGQLRIDVQKMGYASVRDTNLKGISAIAAPIHDFAGRLCAVLTVLGATGSFDTAPDGLPTVTLLAEAATVGRILGHTGESG